MNNIEYVLGQEQYTSNWAKFRVEGLEKWAVHSELPKDIQGKQNSYQSYTCLETPEETTFSIFEQSGNKRSIQKFNFYICVTSSDDAEVAASHSRGRCKGNFKIVCVGEGKVKAPQLMDWWTHSEDHSLEFALHCAAHINKRGLKELPPLSPRTEAEVITGEETSPRTEDEVNDPANIPEPEITNDLQPETAATPERERKQWLHLGLITLNAGTQSRQAIHQATIDDYAEQLVDGRWQWEREPLPILFSDGQNFYPGDGHHRIMAADAVGTEEIFVEIRPGTLRDAVFHSTSANKFHGLPRTNADKRNQVELLLSDPEWQLLSDRAIADHCGVSAPLVGKIRAELAQSGTVNTSTKRIDKSGRKIQTANIGTKPKPQPAPSTYPEQELAVSAVNGIVRLPEQSPITAASIEEVMPGIKPSSPKVERAIPQGGQRFAIATGIASPEQTQTTVYTETEALNAVVEEQITLLSHKFGAKSIAEIALELCSLEEIREIHAELSVNLEALDEEE